MASSIEECKITDAVVRHLRRCRWQILSVHYPGAHGGTRFRPTADASAKSAGTLIPDIVAQKGTTAIFVESKPAYYPPDARKVTKLVSDRAYLASIRRQVFADETAAVCLVPALAFAHSCQPRDCPPGIVCFLVDGDTVRAAYTSAGVAQLGAARALLNERRP